MKKFALAMVILMVSATSALAADYFIYSDTAVSGYACGGYRINDYSGNLYVDHLDGTCLVFKVEIPAESSAFRHQHPQNLESHGPVVARTFTLIQTYNFVADCGWSEDHHAEFWVDANYIYYGVRNAAPQGIAKWNKITTPAADYGKFGAYIPGQPNVPGMGTSYVDGLETFGYDVVSGKWFAGTRNDGNIPRDVYSCTDAGNWTKEFSYAYFKQTYDHHDGLECAGGYVFVSDMTADSIGKWQNQSGTWVEVGRYGYDDPQSWDIEGMGYGPLDHFWATSGNTLYEFGGGKLIVPPQAIPALTTWGLIIFGIVLLGFISWVFLKRRKVIGVRS
jgi:hypothetical protein